MKFINSLTVLVFVLALSATAQDEIPRVGQKNVEPPRFTYKLAPQYPEKGLKVRLEGYVILEATLGKDGIIRDIDVLRGLGKGKMGFEEASIDALKQWQYSPGTVNGVAADVRMTLKIDFVLQGPTRLQLLSWDAGQSDISARPPRVSLEEEKRGEDASTFSLPVTVQLDAASNVVTLEYDVTLLNVFAFPETIQTELDKVLGGLTFETATRDGVGVPSSADFMVTLPLN